jgi:moderate conductance mechanosensitive channel
MVMVTIFASFLGSATDSSTQQFVDAFHGNNPLFRIVITIIGLAAVQMFLHATVDRIVVRAVRHHKYSSLVEEHKREDTLKKVFRATITVVLWVVGLVVILGELHVRIAPLLTGAGVVGVVAGLGAQNLIKDALAGVFIIIENQIRVGDIVTLATATATVSGVVEDITIRTTRLRDLDGNLHILTNGAIGVITNQSYQYAQVNLNFDLNYNTDIDLVEKLIAQAGKMTAETPELVEFIIEPITFLRVDSINESSITVKALGKVTPGNQWAVAGNFRRHIKKLFDTHGVLAPYSQVMVHTPKKK